MSKIPSPPGLTVSKFNKSIQNIAKPVEEVNKKPNSINRKM